MLDVAGLEHIPFSLEPADQNYHTEKINFKERSTRPNINHTFTRKKNVLITKHHRKMNQKLQFMSSTELHTVYQTEKNMRRSTAHTEKDSRQGKARRRSTAHTEKDSRQGKARNTKSR